MSTWSVTCDGHRAEVLALCIALELHPKASYERPAERHGKRTPDWLLHLPDGRSAAMEVTSKTDGDQAGLIAVPRRPARRSAPLPRRSIGLARSER